MALGSHDMRLQLQERRWLPCFGPAGKLRM